MELARFVIGTLNFILHSDPVDENYDEPESEKPPPAHYDIIIDEQPETITLHSDPVYDDKDESEYVKPPPAHYDIVDDVPPETTVNDRHGVRITEFIANNWWEQAAQVLGSLFEDFSNK